MTAAIRILPDICPASRALNARPAPATTRARTRFAAIASQNGMNQRVGGVWTANSAALTMARARP